MKPLFVDSFPELKGNWMLWAHYGVRDTHCSLDTLKKLSRSGDNSENTHENSVFWQVLPSRTIGSKEHVSWCAFSVLQTLESDSLHFRQPELELLGRVAGTFQWEKVQSLAGLKKEDTEVIVVAIAKKNSLNEKEFVSICKKWGLKFKNWPTTKKSKHNNFVSHETDSIERSALAGL